MKRMSTVHDQAIARNREMENRAYLIADRLWKEYGGYEGASSVVAENSTPDSVWPIVQHFLDARDSPPKASTPKKRLYQCKI